MNSIATNHINSAFAANVASRYDEALQFGLLATKLASAEPTSWYNLGVAQRGLGQVEAAKKSQKRSADLSHKLVEAQNAIGLEFIFLQAYPDAEKCLVRAIQHAGDYALPYLNLDLAVGRRCAHDGGVAPRQTRGAAPSLGPREPIHERAFPRVAQGTRHHL